MIVTGSPYRLRRTITFAACSPVVTADSIVVIPMLLLQKSPAR